MYKSAFFKPMTLIAALTGIVIGSFLTFTFGVRDNRSMEHANGSQEPLYWVAPMDSNYRKNKPGLSPMGMDLIPVYEEGIKVNDAGPGTINISPDVINNVGVRTGKVERKPLNAEIVTVGYVQYNEEKRVHIHPRVSGWIETLHIKATGDQVVQGAPLYALYSPELVNAQEELVLAVNSKNQRLIQATENRLRALKIPEYFIKKLKEELTIQQTVTFYAPQNGVVDNLNIREGFFVQPGTTIMSIAAIDEVWVEAEIFERQASLVKIGDSVEMTLDYLPGKKWNGKVDYVYPVLDNLTRTARIRLRFDNAKRELKPNMFAQVKVHIGSSEPLLVIPREALIRTGSQDRVVLALGEGSFKSIEVTVGRQDRMFVEILDGVDEDEKVVTSAQFLLDSESSKTSDFKRMYHGEDTPVSVWVAGEIESAMVNDRMVTASHEAIEDWHWPPMIMDFTVSEKVDFNALTPGTVLNMEISKLGGGRYEISNVDIINQVTTDNEIDHAKMNHDERSDNQSTAEHDNHIHNSTKGE